MSSGQAWVTVSGNGARRTRVTRPRPGDVDSAEENDDDGDPTPAPWAPTSWVDLGH